MILLSNTETECACSLQFLALVKRNSQKAGMNRIWTLASVTPVQYLPVELSGQLGVETKILVLSNELIKVEYPVLLHIMCGYQCDKAVNKNDTREVIWYHFTSEMISYHFTGLNCPIKYIVIIWLDQSGCTFYFGFRLTPGVKFGGKNCFAVLSTLSCTSTGWLDFF